MRPGTIATAVAAVCAGLAGPALAAASTPTPAELAKALSDRSGEQVLDASRIRWIQCSGLKDKPARVRCTFQQRVWGRAWTMAEAALAIDGGRWVVIDGPTALNPL